MPTVGEITELKECCDWEWDTQNDRSGFFVTSKLNGKSIFLPAGGRKESKETVYANLLGRYWTSSLDTNLSINAICLTFTQFFKLTSPEERLMGQLVRPVTE